MNSKTKTFLTLGASLILITACVVGYFAYSMYSLISGIDNQIDSFNQEIPNEIKETRILKGADFLSKTEVFKLSNESTIETLQRSVSAKDEKEKQRIIGNQTAKKFFGFDDIKVFGKEIVAVGQFGGYVFDLQGNLKKEILFEPISEKIKFLWFDQENYRVSLDNIEIVSLNADKYGFITNDLRHGAIVYDENGNQIWNFGKEEIDLGSVLDDENKQQENFDKSKYVLSASAGDLDNDGIAEYIVGKKNEGIYAFDQNGNQKWFQTEKDDSFGDFIVADFDDDDKNDILELIGMGTKLRDSKGKFIKKPEMEISRDCLLWAEGKDKKKLPQFLGINDNKLTIVDFNQKPIFETFAPLSEVKSGKPVKPVTPTPKIIDEDGDGIVAMPMESSSDDTESVYDPNAIWVKLKKDKPKYLAVVAPFVIIPRTMVYVYDEKGTLVYHEIIAENTRVITVLPNDDGNEAILVGGKDTIWKFAAK